MDIMAIFGGKGEGGGAMGLHLWVCWPFSTSLRATNGPNTAHLTPSPRSRSIGGGQVGVLYQFYNSWCGGGEGYCTARLLETQKVT
jgi:hypothetical protein